MTPTEWDKVYIKGAKGYDPDETVDAVAIWALVIIITTLSAAASVMVWRAM